MTALVRRARRRLGMTRRWLFPTAEVAAFRSAWRRAEMTPRLTPGVIAMLEYRLRYSDLLSFCPQWEDIFVKRTLDFRAQSDAPRILDCGANVGLASLYFKRRYPRARITAYEADPTIFGMLDANMRENGAGDVERVHAAVWTRNGQLAFESEGSDSGMIAELPGAIIGERHSVPSIRLRDVLAAERIDLLKLDIEGAEGQVLADCADVLGGVGAIHLEVHEFDPVIRQTPSVLDMLTRGGFAYAIGSFVSLTWRDLATSSGSPFPGHPLTWAMTIRAWRRV